MPMSVWSSTALRIKPSDRKSNFFGRSGSGRIMDSGQAQWSGLILTPEAIAASQRGYCGFERYPSVAVQFCRLIASTPQSGEAGQRQGITVNCLIWHYCYTMYFGLGVGLGQFGMAEEVLSIRRKEEKSKE